MILEWSLRRRKLTIFMSKTFHSLFQKKICTNFSLSLGRFKVFISRRMTKESQKDLALCALRTQMMLQKQLQTCTVMMERVSMFRSSNLSSKDKLISLSKNWLTRNLWDSTLSMWRIFHMISVRRNSTHSLDSLVKFTRLRSSLILAFVLSPILTEILQVHVNSLTSSMSWEVGMLNAIS